MFELLTRLSSHNKRLSAYWLGANIHLARYSDCHMCVILRKMQSRPMPVTMENSSSKLWPVLIECVVLWHFFPSVIHHKSFSSFAQCAVVVMHRGAHVRFEIRYKMFNYENWLQQLLGREMMRDTFSFAPRHNFPDNFTIVRLIELPTHLASPWSLAMMPRFSRLITRLMMWTGICAATGYKIG